MANATGHPANATRATNVSTAGSRIYTAATWHAASRLYGVPSSGDAASAGDAGTASAISSVVTGYYSTAGA